MGEIDKYMTKRYWKSFTIASGVVASGLSEINITTNDKEEYAPFNFLYVVNKSGQVISFYPNGISANKIVVANGTNAIFTDLNFTTLTMKNEDLVNATDDAVYVHIQKDIGTREFLIIMYKAIIQKITGGK